MWLSTSFFSRSCASIYELVYGKVFKEVEEGFVTGAPDLAANGYEVESCITNNVERPAVPRSLNPKGCCALGFNAWRLQSL